MSEADGAGEDRAPEEWPGKEWPGEDWLVIWRSELAALAVDRELSVWWALARRGGGGMAPQPRRADDAGRAAPAGSAGADAPARAAAAAAASDALGAEIERLRARIGQLEHRLDRGVDPGLARG